MDRRMFTMGALLAFLSGVAVYPFFSWIFLVGFLFLMAVTYWYSRSVFFVMITALFFFFGLIRAACTDLPSTPKAISWYTGRTISLSGRITDVDLRRTEARYTLHDLQIPTDGAGGRPVSGKILIILPLYPVYGYGQRLHLNGLLEIPFESADFSYKHYLSRYGIYGVFRNPKIFFSTSPEGWGPPRWLFQLRSFFMERIRSVFPEPQASFLAGLLTGERRGLSEKNMDSFNAVGLTHILAVSGYNIALVILCISWLLRPLPRRIGFIASIFAVVFFVLFVGGSASVVRAGLMGILSLFALHHGRQKGSLFLLLWSAALMVVWNPKMLWWDAGFQLSFASVSGLIFFSPLLEPYLRRVPDFLALRESLNMTLAAQIATLPVVLFHFGRLSFVAPLANVLVSFAIPPAMALGFLAVCLGSVFPFLIPWFGFPGWIVLTYILKVVELLSVLPYASITIPRLRAEWLFFSYLGLVLVYAFWFRLYSCRMRRSES